MSIGPGTAGTKAVEKDYPYEEGLIPETTKQTGNPNLEEEGSEHL